MNRALVTILSVAILTPSTSWAQTRLESNAQDLACEWTDSKGNAGNDTCHITAQGTEQGETTIAFTIGSRKQEYVAADSGWARLFQGEKTLWEGKTTQFTFKSGIMTLKFSDGVTVRLHYK